MWIRVWPKFGLAVLFCGDVFCLIGLPAEEWFEDLYLTYT
jgi:hypothetical protein